MATDPFRIREHVADFDDIVAGIKARSALARSILPMKANIAYGDGPSEKLDIFLPGNTSRPLPVHLFIHGGYWRMFSKDDYSCIANTVTAAGAIAVIVDYALMPSVTMPAIVDQMRRAKHWIVDRIAGFGGDADRFTISGHSAGAQLASCLFSEDQVPSGIKSALLLGGLYDLSPLQKSFLREEIDITGSDVKNLSPVRRKHDPETAVTILVGARETPPFHAQAGAYAKHLSAQGLRVSQTVVVSRNHMCSVRDLGDPDTITGKQLTRLITSAL